MTEQGNRYGGASHAPGVRPGAVIRIDKPEMSVRRRAGHSRPRLLTPVGEWKRVEQPGPDDDFGFRIGLCVAALAARSVRAVQVLPQEVTRLTSCGHRNFEGPCVVRHCRSISRRIRIHQTTEDCRLLTLPGSSPPRRSRLWTSRFSTASGRGTSLAPIEARSIACSRPRLRFKTCRSSATTRRSRASAWSACGRPSLAVVGGRRGPGTIRQSVCGGPWPPHERRAHRLAVCAGPSCGSKSSTCPPKYRGSRQPIRQ